MFKLISHAAIFLIGAGAGVYWGVNHPTQAADVSATESAKIQQAVAAARQDVLQQVVADQKSTGTATGQPAVTPAATLNKYQLMLQNAQSDLNSAKAKLNNQ